MNEKKISELKKTAEEFSLPTYTEIPEVGLYLEQVVRYVEKYAENAFLQPLTNSMISNYVKKKIIANPVKKMYDREQIAYLIFIVFAKNVIQIEDMQKFFQMQKKSFSMEQSYEYFRVQMRESILEVFGIKAEEKTAGEVPGDANSVFTYKSILKNICNTVAHKMYLDSCIRIYGEDPL